jgi:hypothetical protein
LSSRPEKPPNVHLQIIEVICGFLLFAWGAFCFISWLSTSDLSSLKLAIAGLGVGCLLLVAAYRSGKKTALLEQSEENHSQKD